MVNEDSESIEDLEQEFIDDFIDRFGVSSENDYDIKRWIALSLFHGVEPVFISESVQHKFNVDISPDEIRNLKNHIFIQE